MISLLLFHTKLFKIQRNHQLKINTIIISEIHTYFTYYSRNLIVQNNYFGFDLEICTIFLKIQYFYFYSHSNYVPVYSVSSYKVK